MCQLTYVNLGDTRLNKRAFFLLGTLGSSIHKDGWGISYDGGVWKCALPMYCTTDAGSILDKVVPNNGLPFIGHIRQASPKVPVSKENSHPFATKEISFVHNGKLTPLDEKKFQMDYEVEMADANGKMEKKKFNVSDSKLYFTEFLKHYKGENTFVEALQESMKAFYGKFAFMFRIGKNHYIVRGKTADLYITYLMDKPENGEVIGYYINTSKENSEVCTTLMEGLAQSDGDSHLYFTDPSLLTAETIYRARETTLEVIGELKENSAPTYSYHNKSAASGQTFMGGVNTANSMTSEETLLRDVHEFLTDYYLTVNDFDDMLMFLYGISLLELEPGYLKHFVEKIIPKLKNKVRKSTRKSLRKALPGGVFYRHLYLTKNIQFPWPLNEDSVLNTVIQELRKMA